MQELEAPPIVRLARYEPLLHDAQNGPVPVRLSHRRGVARKEGAHKRDESWDEALLRPDSRRDDEREGAILDWHAPVQRQHMYEDLEDIGYVFCDKSIGGWPQIGQNNNTRSICFYEISVNGEKSATSNTEVESGTVAPKYIMYAGSETWVDNKKKTRKICSRKCTDQSSGSPHIAEDVDEPIQKGSIFSDRRLLCRDDDSRNIWELLRQARHIGIKMHTHNA